MTTARPITTLLCLGFVASCADRQVAIHSQEKSQWFLRPLSNAPSVIRYSHEITGKWSWLLDYEEPGFAVIAVGEDMSDHFTRGLTVKVLRNGAVYILENNDGDETWRLDRPPPPS